MTRTKTIRRLLACALVFATMTAACSTGDSNEGSEADTAETDGSGSTTTAAPTDDTVDGDTTDDTSDSTTTAAVDDAPRTASFRGVTEDSIDIGVGFWDTSVFGFGFFGDTDAVWSALTGAVNADNGVNGRSLEYTIAPFSPADNEGMLAACIELTEDAQVFAVLGGMRGDANFCVFEQHETIHLGSQVTAAGEALERARAPIAGLGVDGTDREIALINELDGIGWFDDAAAVGVHYDGSDTQARIGADVDAALADVGVEVALTLNLDDLVLDDDTLEAQVEIMQEQAREADIDRMVIFGPAATGLIAYGELGIPLAAVDSDNFPTAIQQGLDPSALDGTVATATRANLPTDPVDDATQECIDDVAGALTDERFERPGPGVVNTEDDPNYWSYTVLACRDLQLFVAAATAAGVELTNDSFATGLESLSELSLPELPFASYGPDKYNGGDTFRLVEFDAAADEDGELVALTDPIDLNP